MREDLRVRCGLRHLHRLQEVLVLHRDEAVRAVGRVGDQGAGVESGETRLTRPVRSTDCGALMR